MRIGSRVWKTALAVAVALAVSRLLRLEHPVFAGVAAIICMQPTVAGSIRRGVERMQATVIGAAFSLGSLVLLAHLPLLQAVRPALVGLTVLAVMLVTIRLRWLDSLVLAAATVVVIMVLPPDENLYLYAASRTLLTFIGIVVATAVNALFMAPRYSGPAWHKLRELAAATETAYRQAVEGFCLRRLDLAQQAQQALADSESLRTGVETTVQWLREDALLRRAVRLHPEQEWGNLGGASDALAGVRHSAATIAALTAETLDRAPHYAQHPARVYEILRELAQLSFAIFGRIRARLAEEPPPAGAERRAWTEDVHRTLIRAVREAHTAPRDIFPLVEVCVVGFEMRRVTELLAALDDALAAAAAAGTERPPA